MSKITKLVCVDSYFGGCPQCGRSDGYVNAGSTHIFYCDTHRVDWIAGANLFSDWKHETEEEQRRKYKHIEGYERVDGLIPGLYRLNDEGALQ